MQLGAAQRGVCCISSSTSDQQSTFKQFDLSVKIISNQFTYPFIPPSFKMPTEKQKFTIPKSPFLHCFTEIYVNHMPGLWNTHV